MKKLRRKRSSIDISAPAAISSTSAPTATIPPLYARFAKTRDGVYPEPALVENNSRTGRGERARKDSANGNRRPDERVFLTAASRSSSQGRGEQTEGPRTQTQVRAVHRKPVAPAAAAAVAAESRHHESETTYGHKHAASWDSTMHTQPVSTASAAAAAEESRHHRSGSSQAAPPSVTRYHSAVVPPHVNLIQSLENTISSQSLAQHIHHPGTSHENTQPEARQKHSRDDGISPQRFLAVPSAAGKDSRYNVSTMAQAPGAPNPPRIHRIPSLERGMLPESFSPARETRDGRQAGPPPTRDPSSHRERKISSSSRHGHALPTPPPSSTSSIMSPRSTASHVPPSAHPVVAPWQHSTAGESSAAPRMSSRSSSSHSSGPTPRRKYSLLAAFGPPMPKPEPQTLSMPNNADSRTEKTIIHSPQSTSVREAEANVHDRRNAIIGVPVQEAPAFSLPQSPQRRTHRVPVPVDPPFSSARMSAAIPIPPPVLPRPQSPIVPQHGLQRSDHSVFSLGSVVPSVPSARSHSSSLKTPEVPLNPPPSAQASGSSIPPLVPPKTPLPPSLGALPDISAFSPFMHPSDLSALAPQTPPKLPHEPFAPPTPQKPQLDPLPPQTPSKSQHETLAPSTESGPRNTSVSPPPDGSSHSSTASMSQSGLVRGRPLIFAAMAATEIDTGVLEVQRDVSFEVVHAPSEERDATFNQNTSFGHGYPTPRSPSPPLPEVAPTELPKHNREGSKASRILGWFRGGDKSRAHGDRRFPSEQKHRSGKESPLPADPLRPRKLCKTSSQQRRRANSNQSEDSVAAGVASAVRVESSSTEGSPSTPLHTSSSMPQLGSPIQLYRNGSISSVESVSPSKSVLGDTSQPHRSKSSRDGNGVKTLTKRQVEKLQNRIPSIDNHSPRGSEEAPATGPVLAKPPTPISPEEYAQARSRRRGERLQKTRPVGFEPRFREAASPAGVGPPVEVKEPTYYPLARHLTDPTLLSALLPYLSFYEWCVVARVSKEVRTAVEDRRELTELVLERYLKTVGYTRWWWDGPDPLFLTVQDLHSYMRGVSMPMHQYSRLASAYLQSRDASQADLMRELTLCCRAFTRLVLRLRAQAETEAAHNASIEAVEGPLPTSASSVRSPSRSAQHSRVGSMSRNTSRAPSPSSTISHARGQSYHSGTRVNTFHSPLFRLRRAPLLQVFVPSPEGDWLSDAGVLECEDELKRAGVIHLMRAGDVVWDTAVGDEGNAGRMLWDGTYLIDLNYTFSRIGEVPHYLPTLAFPPSYFHRVIRSVGSGNPICYVDISPWGEEIASNLQLMQDKVKTETPQGSYHTVMRWVHRSSFVIRQPPPAKLIRIPVPPTVGPGPAAHGAWVVDPGWYGTVVVEAEGTNEGLADLQARCKGAFPPRAVGASPHVHRPPKDHRSLVFRILRERSRPGEIWIRTVREEERLLPS